jgi:hypothetical protein
MPRTTPKIYSLRSVTNLQMKEFCLLLTDQEKFGIKIIKLNTIHNDMNDRIKKTKEN